MYHRINGPKLGKDFKLSEGLEFDFYSKKLVTRETIVKNIEENVMPKRSSDRALESIGNTILRSSKSTAEKDKIANDPDFILLDEPFAGVDPIAVEDIQEIVRYLKQKGLGILITPIS